MIAKSVHGSGFRGVLDYNLSNSARGHNDARIIGGTTAGRTPRELASEFGAVRALNGDVSKPVYHLSLRLAPGERLDDERFAQVADRFMVRIGFENAAYTIVRHAEDHVHVIACRVGLDGKTISDSNERWRQKWLAYEVEVEFGLKHAIELTPKPSTPQDAPKIKISQAELEHSQRLGVVHPKITLAAKINDAITFSQGDQAEFLRCLADTGVTVHIAQNKSGKINGASFELRDAPAGFSPVYKGSEIHKSYSWQNIGKALEAQREQGLKPVISRAAEEQAEPAITAIREDHRRDGEPGRTTGSRPGELERRAQAGAGADGPGAAGPAGPGAGAQGRSGEHERARRALDAVGPGRHEESRHSHAAAVQDAAGASAGGFGAPGLGGGSSGGRGSALERITDMAASKEAGVSKDLEVKRRAIKQQTDALAAERYRITYMRQEPDEDHPGQMKRVGWNPRKKIPEKNQPERLLTADELCSDAMLNEMRRNNARGWNVVMTPIDRGHHYIVIDDIMRDAVPRLKAGQYQPALVLESSPGNWQAIMKVPTDDKEASKHAAHRVARHLNQTYGDPEVLQAGQPFRVAGFNNRKEKYRQGNHFPFVGIIGAPGGSCSRTRQDLDAEIAREQQQKVAQEKAQQTEKQAQERAKRERVLADIPEYVDAGEGAERAFASEWKKSKGLAVKKGWEIDESALDFRAARGMLAAHWDPAAVRAALLAVSPSVVDRHYDPDDYARRTVQKAQEALEEQQQMQQEREEQEEDDNDDAGVSSGFSFSPKF